MTTLALPSYAFVALQQTSGRAVDPQPHNFIANIFGVWMTAGTSSSEPQEQWIQALANTEATNSGLPSDNTEVTPRAAIHELRRRSGLTWDQLGQLFGVSRRSVHFWASGEKLSAAHEERVMRLLDAIRYVDRGSIGDTRSTLTTPLDDGVTLFDLLVQDKTEEFKRTLGLGPRRSALALSPLSTASQRARLPLSPEERVGALQDPVHRDVGKTRIAKTAKVVRDR